MNIRALMVLNEDKTVFLHHISYFIIIFVDQVLFGFYSKALRKYLTPSNFFLLFSCAHVIKFFFQKCPYKWDTDCEKRINFQIEVEATSNTDT